jgi:CubicO group peptidase (beta-lactamase class C family)
MAGLQYAGREDFHPDAIEQHVRALHSVQLTHPVGAVYEYSNLDYQTLGLIIQQVTGQSYEVYMQEHIFKPLGMSQTFTDQAEAQQHGLATGYRYWFGFPMPYDSLMDLMTLSGYIIASRKTWHISDPSSQRWSLWRYGLVSPQVWAQLWQCLKAQVIRRRIGL